MTGGASVIIPSQMVDQLRWEDARDQDLQKSGACYCAARCSLAQSCFSQSAGCGDVPDCGHDIGHWIDDRVPDHWFFVMSTVGGKYSHVFFFDTPLFWGPDTDLIVLWAVLHKLALPALSYVIFAAHTAGALKHRFINKHDDAFQRMVT